MLATETSLRTLIPSLLHAGLVEIRFLALEGSNFAQIGKLADVLEFLPNALEVDAPTLDKEVVREQFEQYAEQFPGSLYAQRYLAMLDSHEPSAED